VQKDRAVLRRKKEKLARMERRSEENSQQHKLKQDEA